MKKNPEKIEIGDEVLCPDGVGKITDDTIFGQFEIDVQGVGKRWYFEEDLEILEKKGGDNLDRNAAKI